MPARVSSAFHQDSTRHVFHPADLHRQAAKEVGVQIESLRATTFPNARFSERVLHLHVSESPVYLASAQCALHGCLPVGWQGLVAVGGAFEMSGGSVQVI